MSLRTPENHGVPDTAYKMPSTDSHSHGAVLWFQDNYVLSESIL